MKRIDFEQLNKPQLIDMVQHQTDLVQELTDTVLRLQVLAKTSAVSSKQPSKDKESAACGG